ncbi:GDSL esterase/lipase [Dendrobium catenatum]|uniref:GDSL esterase/lipase n=1 Tax=Dendrobium catenatum TaxID=906689 RepID=A0A2I0W140_9ASPA|nr:GDSL esterase/lipase [Dendrobium catenatum]
MVVFLHQKKQWPIPRALLEGNLHDSSQILITTVTKHNNWKCTHHRRSVAACLVQSVYILERDRQEHREEPEALAPPWWESFHFELNRKLVDDADSSIFGAIFEYKPPTSNLTIADAPRFVIVFRGTITKKDSLNRDLRLDWHLIQNSLHQTTRFEIAMQAVRNIVSAVGNSNIWLAGHSLGSAMASLAGRNMAKIGILLEAYLFNPPFFSAPIERIKGQKVKNGIRIANSFVTAGLSFILQGQQESSTLEDPFVSLSSWVPNLFVNPNDHICSEYIGYFQHRKNMEDLGIGMIEKLATRNSLGDIFLRALGKESEPLHLLPSAKLILNLSPSPDFKTAHGIHQWWRPDLHLQTMTYIYS